MYKFIQKYVYKYWVYYCFGLFFLVITNYLSTLIPLLFKDVFDLITVKKT